MIIEKDFAGRQIQGNRDYQEDFYAFSDARRNSQGEITELLLALADGMGGHNAGEYASQLCVDTFVDRFHEIEDHPKGRLLESIKKANEKIREQVELHPQVLEGMGTTFIGALINSKGVQWVSIGDSILALIRNGQFIRLNADHSLMPILRARVAAGYMTQEQMEVHPDRNTLRAAVIGEPLDLIDLANDPYPLQKGDILLCATDGLMTLSESGIAGLVTALDTQTAATIAESLLSAVSAVHSLRQDNATVSVVKIT